MKSKFLLLSSFIMIGFILTSCSLNNNNEKQLQDTVSNMIKSDDRYRKYIRDIDKRLSKYNKKITKI